MQDRVNFLEAGHVENSHLNFPKQHGLTRGKKTLSHLQENMPPLDSLLVPRVCQILVTVSYLLVSQEDNFSSWRAKQILSNPNMAGLYR